MASAKPKATTTDRHAKRLAGMIAKGAPPPLTDDLDLYFERSPDEIFAAFDGAARHMPPAGSDDALAFGYLFLLQGLLERLRYRADRGYQDASRLIDDFQAAVAAQAEAGQIDGHMLAFVGGVLQQSKIPASAELVAASANQPVGGDEAGMAADVRAALAGSLEAVGGDPFQLLAMLSEVGHAMPPEARGALGGAMALGGTSESRAAAVLFLLDPDPLVRHMSAEALLQVASSLAPADIRRLIAMRNWRPDDERTEIDALVRNARAAGIACAQWDAGSAEAIRATPIDGSGTQAFLLLSPAGRKLRLSSILTKAGIADAWSSEPQSRRRTEAIAAEAEANTASLAVSRAYLDRTMAHHLALDLGKGKVPPIGLLETAETIGGADWQPVAIDFRGAITELLAEIPEEMRRPPGMKMVLSQSGRLTDLLGIVDSWFEDDPEVAALTAKRRRDNQARLATYLLQTVISRRREKWAELMTRTALWMRETPAGANLCWRELVILAKAIVDGEDLSEIGLMRGIAQRTISVLGETARF
jgi:hypothetical protein